jgi:hypothetical protein
MWTKVYSGLLAVAVLPVAFFSYYALSWLGSVGDPQDAAAGFAYHTDLGIKSLWAFSVILLLVANIILWTLGRAWAIWTTFLYFAIGTVVNYFWLASAGAEFQRDSSNNAPRFIAEPFVGVALVAAAAVLIFLNQLTVVHMQRSIIPPVDLEPDDTEPIIDDRL